MWPPRSPFSKAEISEAEWTFGSMPALERDVFQLDTVEVEHDEIASLLQLRRFAVPKLLNHARRHLAERLENVIIRHVRQAKAPPGTVQIRTSEARTAQITLQHIPRECRKPFILHAVHKLPETEIAAKLQLDVEKVQQRIGVARKVIWERAAQAGESANLDGEDIDTARYRILQHIRLVMILRNSKDIEIDGAGSLPPYNEREADRKFTAEIENADHIRSDEMQEVEKAISGMDYDTREAFVLRFGIGVGLSAIAEIQKISVEEAENRLMMARQAIRRHVERLIVLLFRELRKEPETPRLSDSEDITAIEAFDHIPVRCRKPYIRFLVDGMSVEQIAAELRLPIVQVKERLQDSTEAIMRRAIEIATLTMKRICDGRPQGEFLLGDPKRIRFSADLWNQTAAEDPSE